MSIVRQETVDDPAPNPPIGVPREHAVYASDPRQSRGRLCAECESPTRTAFQRDRDRIIHSTAFRRLMHKTQVFVCHEGDHYRTRLTHSLEVSQIARTMSRTLALDEDLAEALALAHDLGHPPFGHAGEQALAESMAPFGNFDHNAQTLRLLTKLEARYADFNGLNLTWETLEGIAKHNGPVRAGNTLLPEDVRTLIAKPDMGLDSFAGAEAQIAALSDDIAYNNHDIDDGLRAHLFTFDDLTDLPVIGEVFSEVADNHPGLGEPRLIHESVRRLIDLMVSDVVAETRRRLTLADPRDADAVRRLGDSVAAFSDRLGTAERELKTFLRSRMYRHPRVDRMADGARRIVRDLFGVFYQKPEALPRVWREKIDSSDGAARVVADYIAGMTDRYAIAAHQMHFPDTPDLSTTH